MMAIWGYEELDSRVLDNYSEEFTEKNALSSFKNSYWTGLPDYGGIGVGIVRKNFLIVSSLIAGTILILLGFMVYVMPIYYNQAKQLELKKDYVTIVKELDGQSKESLLSNIKKYDQRYPNILLNLLTSSGEAVYPSASDKEIIAQSQHYLKKGNFDQIGSWSKLITSSDGENTLFKLNMVFNLCLVLVKF